MRLFYIVLILILINGCSTNYQKFKVTFALSEVNKQIVKIDFLLTNKDTIDYFIPFIRPSDVYSHFRYKDSSFLIQDNIDVDFILTNNLLTKQELFSNGYLDSITNFKDTLTFFFSDNYAKAQYDKIVKSKKLSKQKNIYPFFYHAVGNGCVFLKKGESHKLVVYIHHSKPVDLDSLEVSFDFDTKKNDNYRNKYFKFIPHRINSYMLFKGKIFG